MALVFLLSTAWSFPFLFLLYLARSAWTGLVLALASELVPWVLLCGAILVRLATMHPVLRSDPGRIRSEDPAASVALAAVSGLGWNLLCALATGGRG